MFKVTWANLCVWMASMYLCVHVLDIRACTIFWTFPDDFGRFRFRTFLDVFERFRMFSDIFGCFRIRKVRTVFGSDSDGPVSDSSIRFDRSVETRGSIASHN